MIATLKKLFALGGALAGWRGYAAVLAVGLVIGFGGCWKLRDMMAAQAQLSAERHVVKQVVKQDDLSAKAGTAHAAADTAIQEHGRQVALEIPKHVTPEISRAYPLPVGAVRVLNDAIGLPAVPDAAGQPDDAPSAVTLTLGVPVLADDITACRQNGQQLSDLIGWVGSQAKLARADGR